MHNLFAVSNTADIPVTPVEKHGDIWVKREDLFNVCGANGAKSRAAHFMVLSAIKQGFKGITTAGSRKSPQITIVSQLAKFYGIRFVAHCPEGDLGEELIIARENGAEITQHKAGYNNVIIKRAKDFALNNRYFYIPFGMQDRTAIELTEKQTVNIPERAKRIVITAGSGVNLAGVLQGIAGKRGTPVLAIQVGKSPVNTLNEFGPAYWQKMVTITKSELDYSTEETNNRFDDIVCDPIYEAKCLHYLEAGDLFWVIGLRKSLLAEGTPLDSYN